MLSWLFHRLSGLALSAYLVVHIYDLRAAQRSAQSFTQALAVFQTPFWKIMDLLLVAAVLYHTLNGIRILLFDVSWALKYQRQLFWVAFVLTVGILAFSTVMVLSTIPTEAATAR
jgi:succinate dehydrogenase / fumarate reductase cytochrome b subunit